MEFRSETTMTHRAQEIDSAVESISKVARRLNGERREPFDLETDGMILEIHVQHLIKWAREELAEKKKERKK